MVRRLGEILTALSLRFMPHPFVASMGVIRVDGNWTRADGGVPGGGQT
jgi:hypothetical protein